MAGGTFEVNVSKKRPGDYINFKSKRQQSPNGSTRGTALIPLIGLGWGPSNGILKLTARLRMQRWQSLATVSMTQTILCC